MELLVKQSASTFRGGYYSHGKQFIAKLPIYRINFSDSTETKKHNDIVEQVHTLEKLRAQMKKAQNTASKDNFKRLFVSGYKELTGMINELYGVTEINMEAISESD